MKRLEIREIGPEKIINISNRNTTVRMDEYLMSLPKDVIGKIMMDRGAVMELMGRLKATLNAEYIGVYGGFLNGKLISYVSLAGDKSVTDGSDKAKIPEIQIEVLPEYHGQGFGSELLKRVIRLAHDEFGIDRFKYVVNPVNTVSIALVEKLGGVLQEPKNYAEEMLLKTYVLSAEVPGVQGE